jgi:hypothetical protein
MKQSTHVFFSFSLSSSSFAAWPRYVAAAYWMNVAVIQPSSSTETHPASYYTATTYMFVKKSIIGGNSTFLECGRNKNKKGLPLVLHF